MNRLRLEVKELLTKHIGEIKGSDGIVYKETDEIILEFTTNNSAYYKGTGNFPEFVGRQAIAELLKAEYKGQFLYIQNLARGRFDLVFKKG